MDEKRRYWLSYATGVLGWLFMLLAILTFGDRQNKLDARIIELEKRVHELELMRP